LLAGESFQDDAGKTHIKVTDVPEPAISQRSLAKALKLYFFKTYLGFDKLNRLCWVEHLSDGKIERHQHGVQQKVASATNVLILLHGIIGDTTGIAKGLKLATDGADKTVVDKFDVVLTFDYENLGTSISETAITLKSQLREVGIRETDDKRVTLLAHSMGGLVARWLIEREDGKNFIDHLVMFGTPNNGSPFGRIEDARKLTGLLTTIAMNVFPAFAVFGGTLLSFLYRSKNVTPTLEQMNSASEFIKTLNASEDPRIRYTIVAGDARIYQEESDSLIAKIISKVGSGRLFELLFRLEAHDMAVSDLSILQVTDSREPKPEKHEVVCHHLNYFTSEAGLRALANVKWDVYE
jgi:pimeloyl-ACP methyl ester carboxylesterase